MFVTRLLGCGASTGLSSTYAMFAFLYGTFPTAPSVFLYASQYSIGVDLVRTIYSNPTKTLSSKMPRTWYKIVALFLWIRPHNLCITSKFLCLSIWHSMQQSFLVLDDGGVLVVIYIIWSHIRKKTTLKTLPSQRGYASISLHGYRKETFYFDRYQPDSLWVQWHRRHSCSCRPWC